MLLQHFQPFFNLQYFLRITFLSCYPYRLRGYCQTGHRSQNQKSERKLLMIIRSYRYISDKRYKMEELLWIIRFI